ncbi:Cilia- and flagella-associated protein 126 [Podarcis lilfordi]|uniref:Protein Flattop n=1 Tax=Podarcis lilfordi TaxID=74358 RepID=A0AA35LLB2_9SAUR|nr:Cilia- and flagella-associated protein 126 [Podarcis lilfordi]
MTKTEEREEGGDWAWLMSLATPTPPVARILPKQRRRAASMATHYSSGQYEDAYNPKNLQNWNLPRVAKEHPSAREGYTQFIANDRGHLLPAVPRSKASPWGTYMGTWDMPLKIPPAKVNLTSRSVNAAAHLTEWISKSTALNNACNGFCPEITGKPSDPPPRVCKPVKGGPSSRKASERPGSVGEMPAQEDTAARGSATPKGPLSRQPGCIDVRMKDDLPDAQQMEPKEPRPPATSEIPVSRQPGSMDVRMQENGSPKIPSPSRPSSREPAARRAASAEAPASGWPRSLEGKPKGVSTPELLASCRPGSMEANPRSPLLAEALASSRPTTKGSLAAPDVRKTPLDMGADWQEKGASPRPLHGLEEPSS